MAVDLVDEGDEHRQVLVLDVDDRGLERVAHRPRERAHRRLGILRRPRAGGEGRDGDRREEPDARPRAEARRVVVADAHRDEGDVLGGAVLIFPEGTSEHVPRLLPLKTGVARIALGAEARRKAAGAPQDVALVPVSVRYDDPTSFRSRARVRFLPAIPVAHRPRERAHRRLGILRRPRAGGEGRDGDRREEPDARPRAEARRVVVADAHRDEGDVLGGARGLASRLGAEGDPGDARLEREEPGHVLARPLGEDEDGAPGGDDLLAGREGLRVLVLGAGLERGAFPVHAALDGHGAESAEEDGAQRVLEERGLGDEVDAPLEPRPDERHVHERVRVGRRDDDRARGDVLLALDLDLREVDRERDARDGAEDPVDERAHERVAPQ